MGSPNAHHNEPITSPDAVERTRSRMGLVAVILSDSVIAVAAIIGVISLSRHGRNATEVVAILSSAFTAVSTMTTAYFGIKAVSNTAERLFHGERPSGGQPVTEPEAPAGGVGAPKPGAGNGAGGQ